MQAYRRDRTGRRRPVEGEQVARLQPKGEGEERGGGDHVHAYMYGREYLSCNNRLEGVYKHAFDSCALMLPRAIKGRFGDE